MVRRSLNSHLFGGAAGAPHLVIVGALVILPLLATRWWLLDIAANALVLGVIASSFAFAMRFGRMLSLAFFVVAIGAGQVFVGVGAVQGASAPIMPWLLAVPFALVFSAISGAVVGYLYVRMNALRAIVVSLALALIVHSLVVEGAFSTSNTTIAKMSMTQPMSPNAIYYLCLTIAVGTWIAVHSVSRTALGLMLRVSTIDSQGAQSLGISISYCRLLTHLFAGVLAGVGGVLMTLPIEGFVLSERYLSSPTVFIALIPIAAALGGLSTTSGPFVGSFVLVGLCALGEHLGGYNASLGMVGVAFIIVMRLSTNGLHGLWCRLLTMFTARPSQGAIHNRVNVR